MKRNHLTRICQYRMALVFAVAVALCTAMAGTCQAVDSVKLKRGQIFGKITKMSPYAVTVLSSGVDKEIQVKDIACVYYDGEPGPLKTAKAHAVSKGASGEKKGDMDLCYMCHWDWHTLGRKSFIEKYPMILEAYPELKRFL